ncbi:MarR family winged helix-turn-helix transcriptional regulator [Aromatoleum anaerobium]|uniref:MarR family transcriptional regulator n=1 Tax=Aromatoleum anaerobium TaxID=182180 RepID=A0ABX1PRG9_9RHOO|nr:helix-turn-helix domain-containing protein [Aromatoleum anaerobium]MCK0506425.1 MarR family winged helix-turn-helix transcriptional regulator [Aromatoleum anaerobium]
MESKRGRDLRQLLLMRSEWFEDRVYQGASEKGYGFITPAMVRLFAHMGRRAVSIPELARRLSISRQAVHVTIHEAMRHGVVEFEECSFDRRLKLVKFTDAGMQMLAAADATMDRVQEELEARIGKKDVESLLRILEKTW